MRSMNKNFSLLRERILDANEKITQKELIKKLNMVKGNLITTATGGSYSVSYYASIIMEKYNNCFSKNLYPRDILFMSKKPDYIMAFSYSGKTPSIIQALTNLRNSKKILFTIDSEYTKSIINNNDNVINYKGDIEKEKSFISLASTIIPLSLLLKYSMKDDNNFTENKFNKLLIDIIDKSERYVNELIDNTNLDSFNTVEIFTGDNTYTASYILRSGIIEASIGYPIIYEKNDYCHGCHTLNYNKLIDLAIYLLNKKSKQDDLLIKNALPKYKNVIILETSNDDSDVNIKEFELAVKALFLLRGLANLKKINLSNIRYSKELVSKLYHFKGKMK